jgi:ubiquinone/menaquinone biosynthesis C-methylase UbiE
MEHRLAQNWLISRKRPWQARIESKLPKGNELTTSDETNGHAVYVQAGEAFAQKSFADLVGFANVFMCVLGDRLGLFKDLAAQGPATSAEFAARNGIVERIGREWLSQMACAEYLNYDPTNQCFSLPPAHAPVLAEEGGPGFMGGMYQSFQTIEHGLFIKLLRAFRTGGGVAYSEYDDNFWEGQDRFSISNLQRSLVQHIIPAMPDVLAALERGALIADVGCGRGGILLILAQAFPRSRFVGYDAHAPNIARAQDNAESAVLSGRVRYVCQDVAKGLPESCDIILSFDVLHHANDVVAFLRAIRAALKPGGIYVCQEAMCAETLEENIGPGGAMLYGSGVFGCVPQVLSEGSEAIGPAGLPFSIMREYCTQAGFGNVRLVAFENADANIYEIKR